MMDKIVELEKRLKSAVLPQDRIAVLNELALALATVDLNRAYNLAHEALALEKSIDDDHLLPSTLYVLGYIYWSQGEFSEALQQLTLALNNAESMNEDVLLLQILSQLAVAYLDVGEHAEAVNLYQRLLRHSRDTDNRYYEAVALNGLGLSYSDDQPATVLPYFQQAYTLFTDLGRAYDAAVSINNTAMMLLPLGQLDEALQFGHQALDAFVKLGSSRGKLLALGSLTEIYCQQSDFANARRYFLQAQAIADAEQRQYYQAMQSVLYARIQIGQGIPADAIPVLEKALELAIRIGAKKTVYRIHEAFANVYEALSDFENAYRHYRQYHEAYLQVFSETGQRKIENLRISFETETAVHEANNQRLLREQERQHFERISHMQDELLNIASHDLKNPLATIATLVFLLRHPELSHQERERHLDTIESQINYMQELILKLLGLARLETGVSFDPRLIEFHGFMEKTVDQFEERCAEKQIQLLMTSDFEHLQVVFDPMRLNQAVSNLLSNALKFTPPEGEISVSLEHDEDVVTVKVRDTGIGIPPHAIPHIFERFFRVESDEQPSQEGTGLGLSIVKSIIEQHGGQVSVESSLNEGSTFSFTLPYEQFINGNNLPPKSN